MKRFFVRQITGGNGSDIHLSVYLKVVDEASLTRDEAVESVKRLQAEGFVEVKRAA